MTRIGPLQHYQNTIATGQICYDETQQQALSALEQLHQQLNAPVNASQRQQPVILGLYLWGKVGRGKTFLMDRFAESFDEGVCLRQHFHHFMQYVHSQLTQLSGCKDPLQEIAYQLKSRHTVLCFDEFFVNDIGDAMILGRLIMYLFEKKMIVVVTSNCEPNELYKDGLQRPNFLPAIHAIYKNMNIVELEGLKDHRERNRQMLKNYFVINKCIDNKVIDKKTNNDLIVNILKCFEVSPELSAHLLHLPGTIKILGRDIHYLSMYKKTIVFDFKALCLGPRSHFDYIEIAKQFSTLFLTNIPVLGGEMFERIKARGTEDGSAGSGDTGQRQILLAPMDDGARRFIALIDELYDQKVIVYLTCHIPLEKLYTHGSLAFQFERARSRIIEMGSEEYMNRATKEIAIT